MIGHLKFPAYGLSQGSTGNAMTPGQFAIADAKSRTLTPFWAPDPAEEDDEESAAFTVAWLAVVLRLWASMIIILFLLWL